MMVVLATDVAEVLKALMEMLQAMKTLETEVVLLLALATEKRLQNLTTGSGATWECPLLSLETKDPAGPWLHPPKEQEWVQRLYK